MIKEKKYQPTGISVNPNRELVVIGDIFIKGQSPFGTTIKLFENEKLVCEAISCINGFFRFNLQFNNTYNIKVSREGLITKNVYFDTHIPSLPPTNHVFKFGVELFKLSKPLPEKMNQRPVAFISYIPWKKEFAHDPAYTSKAKEILDPYQARTIN